MIEQIAFRTSSVEIFIDLATDVYVVEVYSSETSRLLYKEVFDTVKEAFDFVNKDYLGGILSESQKAV
jgi:hypothetical protein